MSKQSDLVSVSQGSGGDPLYIDTTNDNVGIGTSSPDSMLHIETISGTAQIKLRKTVSGTSTIKVEDSGFLHINNNSAAGIQFSTSNSERMRIDSSGRVTMPYQPAFFAGRQDGGQSASSGSALAFNYTAFNVGNHYSTSTYRFTAPVAGLYHFTATVYRNSSGNNWGFKKNGGFVETATGFVTNRNDEAAQSISTTIKLSANDYVTVNESGGTTFNWWGAHSHWTGYLIG